MLHYISYCMFDKCYFYSLGIYDVILNFFSNSNGVRKIKTMHYSQMKFILYTYNILLCNVAHTIAYVQSKHDYWENIIQSCVCQKGIKELNRTRWFYLVRRYQSYADIAWHTAGLQYNVHYIQAQYQFTRNRINLHIAMFLPNWYRVAEDFIYSA